MFALKLLVEFALALHDRGQVHLDKVDASSVRVSVSESTRVVTGSKENDVALPGCPIVVVADGGGQKVSETRVDKLGTGLDPFGKLENGVQQ